MIEIDIQPIANQSFTTTLDNNFYDITIKETNGVMSSSITRNNILIQSNSRILPNLPMIPYKYQESGNFIIFTDNDEYPYYPEFGLSQSLFYIPQNILDEIRAQNLYGFTHE
jgi:hypothetical protein